MTAHPDDRYTQADLERLVDVLLLSSPPEEFVAYAIRGVYVSPAVVEQALMERLEKMAGRG